MILANDPKGFSCGEVNALFNPYRPHHTNPHCGCGDIKCNLWQRIIKRGVKNLYKTIFNFFPDIEFIIDSSKNSLWMSYQTKNLLKQDIETEHLLIWKTPLEFAHSFKKRGKKQWHKEWINYHRFYITALKTWRAVKYHDLVNGSDTLKAVCRFSNIPFFSEKSSYWGKKHHTLFGNISAKIHLLPRKPVNHESLVRQSNDVPLQDPSLIEAPYRKIYYKAVNDKILENAVKQQMASNKNFEKMLELFKINDVSNDFTSAHSYSYSSLRLFMLNFQFQRTKRTILNRIMNHRYR
jgi:hypothetical protein